MNLQIAKRKQAKIKMALQGTSGSGKTTGALKIAFGLCGNWSKIAVIDTENYSAALYSELGSYSVVNLTAPYSPEKYIEAIELCEKSSFEVIIIDSISHEWEGAGGILDVHGNMAGNSFTNWSKITPRHNAFVQVILQSSCHIIATVRSKQDYVLTEKNGKQVPEKVGLKPIQRDGTDYEFTIVFDLDIKHYATATKDRTGLFADRPEFKISSEVGKQILDWCNYGEPTDHFADQINACTSLEELYTLYNVNPHRQKSHYSIFAAKKKLLKSPIPIISTHYSLPKSSNNGNKQP